MSAVDEDIVEIATSIWETLFSTEITPAPPGTRPTGRAATGCVHIDGAWRGAVVLLCDEDLAAVLAGELFQSDSPSPEDVRDTVGELTNMLAGNIKALLPEPSRISLPAVALGGDHDLTVRGTAAIAQVAFACGTGSLVVTLLQSSTEGEVGDRP